MTPRYLARSIGLLALPAALWASDGTGAPQASLGMTLGGVLEDATSGAPHGGVHWGGRADVLFLRSRGTDMALGPYADVATSSFHDADVGGGVEWLIPVRDDLPFVLSAGALARSGEGLSWAPGLEGTLFWGSRSFNYHSWYGLAAGLFAQARYVPGSPERTDFVFGLQIDGELLLMPPMLILGLMKWQPQ